MMRVDRNRCLLVREIVTPGALADARFEGALCRISTQVIGALPTGVAEEDVDSAHPAVCLEKSRPSHTRAHRLLGLEVAGMARR